MDTKNYRYPGVKRKVTKKMLSGWLFEKTRFPSGRPAGPARPSAILAPDPGCKNRLRDAFLKATPPSIFFVTTFIISLALTVALYAAPLSILYETWSDGVGNRKIVGTTTPLFESKALLPQQEIKKGLEWKGVVESRWILDVVPLTFTAKIRSVENWGGVEVARIDYSLQQKWMHQLIPLDEQEQAQNEILQEKKLDSIDWLGEGQLVMVADRTLSHQFVLQAVVEGGGKRRTGRIEWAEGVVDRRELP